MFVAYAYFYLDLMGLIFKQFDSVEPLTFITMYNTLLIN